MKMFLISTPEDKGQSSRHIQAINAHSARIKHNSLAALLKNTDGTAPTDERGRRPASRCQLPKFKCRTALMSQQRRQATSFDQVLQSTLDPFIRLPVATTNYERALLHYCLTHGGRRQASPASQNVFDPAIFAASRLLHADKMYVLVHLAMGELMICKRRRVAVTAFAYHWRVQAYRYMSELLGTPDSSFLNRISGLFQLSLMEQAFRESSQQATHLKALYQLVETHGGLLRLKTVSTESEPVVGVSFVTSFFTFVEIPLSNPVDFKSVVGRFGLAIGRLSTSNRSHVYDKSIHMYNGAPLLDIRVYVDQLLSDYLSQSSTPYRLRAGAFGFIFALAMSLTVYELSAASAFQFLVQLEQCMLASTTVLSTSPRLLCPIESIPCSALWLLGYVRSCVLHVVEEKEVEISQSLLDVLRLLRYLSAADLWWLAMSLAQSVFGVTSKDPAVLYNAKLESLIQELGDRCPKPGD